MSELSPGLSGHMRDDIRPEIIGGDGYERQTDGPVLAYAVPDELGQVGAFLWAGGATAAGFVPVPGTTPRTENLGAPVAERLRAASRSGIAADRAVAAVAHDLGATRDDALTTLAALDARVATLLPPVVGSVDRIVAALDAVGVGTNPGTDDLRVAAALADREQTVPGGSGPVVLQAVPFGLVMRWSPDQAFTEAGRRTADGGAWPSDGIAAAAVAATLRTVVDGNDLRAGLRTTSALLHRLQQPGGVQVDEQIRAGARLAGERPRDAAAVTELSGATAADALAVAVYVVLTHPARDDVPAAIAMAEAVGGVEASLVRVFLGALHGPGPGETADAAVRRVATALAEGAPQSPRRR